MKISIVIPYYNRAHTIERCLNSINFNSNQDIEVIIVDDASTDSLPNIFKNCNILRHKFNMGPVAARLTGLDISTGDYVLFLDSDDELVENWHEIVTNTISKYKFNLYGFPDINHHSNNTFLINSINSYWEWTASNNRASDYILLFDKVALLNAKIEKRRMSEVWLISTFFEKGFTGYYSNSPIFIYHQDSLNQLSKSINLKFKYNKFERNSVRYSFLIFKKNSNTIIKYNNIFFKSWLKRFFKESILNFDVKNCIEIFKFIFRK